jgi:3-phosphoshikimate 1-carboxyvinyltransferase
LEPILSVDFYEVKPLTHPARCTIQVPGSKSITNRALILATLAEPHGDRSASTLDNALQSEDTEVMIESLRRLGLSIKTRRRSTPIGFAVEKERQEIRRLTLPCTPRSAWTPSAEFFCGNSGTTMRFLTAMLALGKGRYRLDGVPRMRERPIQDLLNALTTLGATVKSELTNGCPPVVVEARGLVGGIVKVRGDVSSQFLSGLLMAAPYAGMPVLIQIEGELVSVPYVQMTLAMMRAWGVLVAASMSKEKEARWQFTINAPTHYSAQHYTIEPDASSASYFWAAAAITAGGVYVPGLDNSLQGDAGFRDLLVKMGCKLGSAGAVIGGNLHGIDVDMNAMSDTVMTLAVVALFAEGSTTIRNVAHIRQKETDRLAALATELRKVGPKIEEFPDGLRITPGPLQGASLATYNDHRMAMSLALIGLVVPGIRIENPACVGKTYPHFWQDLEKLRQ